MSAALRTIVVLYRPDAGALASIVRLADSGHGVIIVSNGIEARDAAMLAARDDVVLIDNGANVGLATALNQGIAHALGEGADWVMLLDQDSRPEIHMATRLIAIAREVEATGVRLGCLAPTAVDRKGAERVASTDTALVDDPAPATVITSGALVSRAALVQAGAMWRELFIDGIDHEWCFRARDAGFAIARTPRVRMTHDMGDDGVTIAGRYRPLHRSPVRHYHIVRNILWTARLGYVPLAWRLKEIVKLAYRIPVYLAVSRDRPATLRAIVRAVVDGCRCAGRTIR